MDIKDCHWVFLFYRGHRSLSSISKRLSLPYSKREQAQDKEVNDLRNGTLTLPCYRYSFSLKEIKKEMRRCLFRCEMPNFANQ